MPKKNPDAGKISKLERELRAIKPMLRPLPAKARATKKPATATRATTTCRNDYLGSLLDPFNGKGVGIPDFDTSKVLTVQTHNRFPVTTNTGGTAAYVFKPAYSAGIMRVGMTDATSANWHSMFAGPNLTGGNASAIQALKAADIALFEADFEQVRPVSFAAKFVPQQNATQIQGLLYVIDHIPGDAFPVPLSVPTALAGGIESVIGPDPIASAPVVASLADAEAMADHINRIQMTTVTSWTPDLPDNLLWKAIGGTAGNSDSFGTVSTQWVNTTLGGTDTYRVPFEYTNLVNEAGAPVYSAATSSVNRVTDGPLSSFMWVFAGCTGGSTVGDIEIVINWEVQVRPGLSSILPTRVVPSNPDEFAQANNVSQMVPHTYYPDQPNEPTTRLFPHLIDTAKHLYDGTPKKEAIEGTSLWSKIKRVGGKVAGAVAPLLSAIPGVGPILGPGAAFLSTLLS